PAIRPGGRGSHTNPHPRSTRLPHPVGAAPPLRTACKARPSASQDHLSLTPATTPTPTCRSSAPAANSLHSPPQRMPGPPPPLPPPPRPPPTPPCRRSAPPANSAHSTPHRQPGPPLPPPGHSRHPAL